MRSFAIALLAGAVAAVTTSTAAQAPEHANNQPSMYRSAFADYRPFKDQPLATWRDANREVGRIGGHAGLLRGAGAADPAAPTSSPPVPKDAASDTAAPAHQGHH